MIENLAKVVIWSEDRASPGLESIARSMEGLSGAVGTVRSSFAALGSALGVGAFTAYVKSAIDAADEVNKLAQKTGLTVEAFQRLKYAADLADVDSGTLSKGLKGLSVSMVEASREGSEAGKVLKALGVDLKGGVNEAVLKLADTFAALPDSELKIAAATKAFGKAGQDMIPFLNQGSRGIRELGDEAVRLGIVMSSDTTKAAEEFNDNLKRIRSAGDRLAVAIVNDFAPGMVRITKAMRLAAEESGVLKAAWVGLGGVASEALGINDEDAQRFKANLRRLNAELLDFGSHIKPERQRELLAGIATAGNMIEASFVKANFQLKLTQTTLDAISGKFDDQVSRAGRQGQRLPTTSRSNADIEDALRRALAGGGDGVERVSEFSRALDDLRTKLFATSQGLDPGFAKAVSVLNMALVTGNLSLEEHAALYAALVRQQPFVKKGLDEEAKLHDSVTKAIADGIAERNKALDTIRDETTRQAAANDAYGLTRTQIEAVTIARLEEQLAMLRQSGAMEDELESLSQEIVLRRRLMGEYARGDKLDALRAERELQRSVWDELSSRGANFFVDLASNGREAFRTLGQSLKEFGQEMLSLFTKRWLLNIGAALTGNPAIAAQAATAGQGSVAGAALNWLGNTTVGSAIGGAWTAGVAGYQGAALAPGLAGPTTAGAGGLMGAGNAVYSFLTNPATIAVLAIAAIAVAAQARRGGPKEGGSFFGGYDASGAFTGSLAVPGSDNGRFFTPNGGDTLARQWGDTAADAFFGILRNLGGSSAGIQFGFGYDRDPRGTADSRVTAMVRGADGRVLLNSIQTGGRDDEDFQRAVGLQTQRAILAGLQGSELPQAIADILSSVAAVTATTEQIDQVFALAGAMKQLLDTLSPLTVEDLMASAGRTAIESWRAQGAQLRELVSSTNLSVESLNTLSQATGTYRAAAAQLIVELESARQSVAGGIASTIRDMRFQTLDRQGQYNMLQGEADVIAGNLGGMQDASQIVDAVNQIRALSSQAFGMLSDDDRRAMLTEYEAGLKEVQRIADERLVALREEVRTETNAQLARQEAIVTDMAAAAARMERAANQFDAAASRLASAEIPVRVEVDLREGYSEVGGGG